jgi:regulation of enolase protein 1 (concanavalin A-like superfamily)
MNVLFSLRGFPQIRIPFFLSTGGKFLAVLLAAALAAFFASAARAQLYTEATSIHGALPGGEGSPPERFGFGVAADGDTIVVSTPTGPLFGNVRAYVFVRGATGWVKQQDMGFPTANVAIAGDTLVGGGVIYIRSGGTWSVQHTLDTIQRPLAALQRDTLVVGAPLDRSQSASAYGGAAYVFTRSGSTWTQQAAFGPDPERAEELEGPVALDGDTFIAGVGSNSGGAYVFVRTATTWTRQARLTVPTSTGDGMGVALEGDTAVVSGPTDKKVYVFTRSGTAWTLVQTLSAPAGGTYFGFKLAFKGGILAVAADYGFLLYSRTSSGFVLAQAVTPAGYGYEGGLALANQGKLLVTGNPSADSSSGKVDIFSVPPAPAPGGGWKDIDVGAVGLAGGSTVNGSQVSVQGSGADIWDRADQFHFRSESLTGDGAIIARVGSAGSGNPWAKAGLMFREDVAPSSRTVMALVTPGGHLGLQARVDPADTTSFVDNWAGAPIWLMLARTGDVFDAFRSADGDHWTPIGSSTVKMPPTIHIGLAVSSHNNAVVNTATFSGIELVGREPPPPAATLVGSDLGTVAMPGNFTDSSGTLAIDAAGADIWNAADSGYFAHREITGDFDLRARVTSLTNTHVWAKAGLMVRESLAAGSRNVFTLLTAGNAAGMQVRAAANAATGFSAGPWIQAPYWVRLVRTGDAFQSMISSDGVTWQTVGMQTLALPATLHAGVAVSSHVAGTATHATVTDLRFGN